MTTGDDLDRNMRKKLEQPYTWTQETGMTREDRLFQAALAAMTGILASGPDVITDDGRDSLHRGWAVEAFGIAEALVAEFEKRVSLHQPQGPTTGVNAVFGACPDMPDPRQDLERNAAEGGGA